MKPFGALISFSEALKRVETSVKPLDRTEFVKVEDSSGRVLAEDITANQNTPPFTRGAMDGFAVKAENTFDASRINPRVLKVIDSSYAGHPATKSIKDGESIQIATGAKMPEGADAVVMVEETDFAGEEVKIYKAVYPKAHVANAGDDIKKGELVLKKGALLNPGKAGVLASQGFTEVKVYSRPRVAVMPTGEEVCPPGADLADGQIYDINSYTITSVANAHGAEPVRQQITQDKKESLRKAIKEVLKNDAVVLSGGSSVGERDLLYDILNEMGEVVFHGIQIKPGKPTLFAIVEGKPVFGMPGYPTSCLINCYLLLVPALRILGNLPKYEARKVNAVLTDNVSGSIGRRQFLPVTIKDGKVTPVFKESGAITTTALADGYIEIAENVDIFPKGEEVSVTLF